MNGLKSKTLKYEFALWRPLSKDDIITQTRHWAATDKTTEGYADNKKRKPEKADKLRKDGKKPEYFDEEVYIPLNVPISVVMIEIKNHLPKPRRMDPGRADNRNLGLVKLTPVSFCTSSAHMFCAVQLLTKES